MPYVPLRLNISDRPHVERFVRGPLESLYFRDVHDMLRLPINATGILGGCNFAIAHVLLAAVSGLSTTLHSPGAGGGRYQKAFCKLLVSFYPWETERDPPKTEADKGELAKTLWKEFRGPLTHHLGLWTEARGGGARRIRNRGYFVTFKRLTEPGGDGLRETAVEQLEGSEAWPFPEFQQTLLISKDTKVLKLERFYWGIRRTVLRLCADKELMGQAEAFLSRVEK